MGAKRQTKNTKPTHADSDACNTRYSKTGRPLPRIHRWTKNEATAPVGDKVQKILADSGMGSRRQMEALLLAGRVQINDETANLGARATTTDRIQVDGAPLHRASGEQRLLLYYKPVGKVVSREEGGDNVFADLPPTTGGRWMSLGRLDVNSEGLLLFSTDGSWVNAMTRPQNEIEREYRVRASGVLDKQTLSADCHLGVKIDSARAIKPRRFTLEREGDGVNCWYRIVLTEGRNRAVRRLFEHYGLQVSRLIRTRFGSYCLPASLSPGDWREIAAEK